MYFKKIKIIFSVPIHRVDVLSQRLLLQQVLPNGLKNKSLYLLGFEKGKMAVSDKKFLRIFKLCLLHRGRSFVRQFWHGRTIRSLSLWDPSTNRIFRSRFVGVLLKNNFYFFSFRRPIPNWSLQPWLSRVARVILMNPSTYKGFGKAVFQGFKIISQFLSPAHRIEPLSHWLLIIARFT